MADTQPPLHIGRKIQEFLVANRFTKAKVARLLGKKITDATKILDRADMRVHDLHKISVALKHNFFNYYPVDNAEDEKSKTIKQMQARIAELEKENGYLKEINDLLRKTK